MCIYEVLFKCFVLPVAGLMVNCGPLCKLVVYFQQICWISQTGQHQPLFHGTMEISVHSFENIPIYTADTVGACDNLVYYLVMHAHTQ